MLILIDPSQSSCFTWWKSVQVNGRVGKSLVFSNSLIILGHLKVRSHKEMDFGQVKDLRVIKTIWI